MCSLTQIFSSKLPMANLMEHDDSSLLKELQDLVASSNVTCIVAPPAMGKTLVGIALGNAMAGKDAVYTSTELPEEYILGYLLPAVRKDDSIDSTNLDNDDLIKHCIRQDLYRAHTFPYRSDIGNAIGRIEKSLGFDKKGRIVVIDCVDGFVGGGYDDSLDYVMRRISDFAVRNGVKVILTAGGARASSGATDFEVRDSLFEYSNAVVKLERDHDSNILACAYRK